VVRAHEPVPPAVRPEPPAAAPRPPAPLPIVTVTEDRSAQRPVRTVERVLGNPAERRADGWRDRVVVVPGGHRPGQPDQLQRDRARARLPVAGIRRVVVLGCTVGAGQSVMTLRTGELLASLRDEPVAVLDLNPGKNSLSERARAIPALTEDISRAGQAGSAQAGSAQAGSAQAYPPLRLEVITSQPEDVADPRAATSAPAAMADAAQIFELLSARYSLTLADPAASAVPRVLTIADQLLLVAPASSEAANAIAMTMEWLEAHGHAGLAEGAIMVLNGVSKQTVTYVEQAEAVASGRCRAIVRVPWDDQLRNPAVRRPAQLAPAQPHRPAATPASAAAERAYTALAGVLVASLVAAPEAPKAELREAGA
jgi:MinD-like ATPase involved in chromosome partitioning or flagellar assembly